MKTDDSVAIVGGGILGMTLALRLSERGHRVTLLESSERPGGLLSTCSIGDYHWDCFYHVVLMSDTHLLELLDELGLRGEIQWGQTRTGFFDGGNHYSLSSTLEFLKFPPLNLLDRIRLGAFIFYASRIKSWEILEQVSVSDWLTRFSGSGTFERIWLPLLRSKLGESYRITNAAFIWAIIARMYAARRTGLKREQFGYVRGGYGRVTDRLQNILEQRGVQVLCSSQVERVKTLPAGVSVETADGRVLPFSRAVFTMPSNRIPPICPDLSIPEQSRLSRVQYQGVICVNLLLERPLAGYYVTNIIDGWVPFTTVIEMTALVDRETFRGNSLVYLPVYLPQDHPYWLDSDDAITKMFSLALRGMFPGLSDRDVIASTVTRAREVMPVPTMNYSRDVLPSWKTSLPSVYVVNSSQVPNGTMNVNEMVGLANRKALEISGDC